MRNPHDVLVKPMVSEKSVAMMEEGKYSFIVDKNANKIEIKHAVEELFHVSVVSVNTRIIRGKIKRRGRFEGKRPDTKRAIVTLKPGNKIEIFTGM